MKYVLGTILVLMLAMGLVAQDGPAEGQGMPEMGAPAEMEHAWWLAGDWNVTMQSRWDPNQTEWVESQGTCTYEKVLDGCAMEFTYNGSAMGMPFLGYGLMSYDRDKKEWQTSWIDNMAARQVLYTGWMRGDSAVMTGHEIYDGMAFDARITTVTIDKDTYEWYYYDMSTDGGKTWWTSGEAVYTRAE